MKRTTEDYKSIINDLVGDEYEVLGEYINNSTPIKMKHNKCGYEFEIRPNNFMSAGNRCPKCSGKKKKNTEEFKNEVFNLVGNEYEVLGEYKTCHTPIKMKHNKCGRIYEIKPNLFLTGCRCSCYTTKEDVIKFVSKTNFELIEYSGYTTKPSKFLCKKCGNVFYKNFESFKKQKEPCPKCTINSHYSLDEIKELIKKNKNNEYEILTDEEIIYKKKKYKFLHKKCGKILETTPYKFISLDVSCKYCNKRTNSKLQKEIINLLIKENISFDREVTFENCYYKKDLYFDIYIEDLKLLIEIDGEQHFKQKFSHNKLETQRKRDIIKNNFVLEHDISLLRISYKEKEYRKIILDLIKRKKFNDYRNLNDEELEYNISKYWKQEINSILIE